MQSRDPVTWPPHHCTLLGLLRARGIADDISGDDGGGGGGDGGDDHDHDVDIDDDDDDGGGEDEDEAGDSCSEHIVRTNHWWR